MVLASPADGDILLKRVVAGPNDMVAVRGGHLFINGTAVPVSASNAGETEDLDGHVHALGGTFGGGPDFGPQRVPKDDYLVLGDNRGNSKDGRFFGWVKREAILGRAVSVCARDGAPVWKKL